MKQYILAVVLLLVSVNALPERVVIGTNEIGDTFGSSKSEACTNAKVEALSKRSYNEQVTQFSTCDCKQNEKGSWSCSVDATLEKTR